MVGVGVGVGVVQSGDGEMVVKAEGVGVEDEDEDAGMPRISASAAELDAAMRLAAMIRARCVRGLPSRMGAVPHRQL